MTLPLVVDAASIRTDAGSVGHDSFSCADRNPDYAQAGSRVRKNSVLRFHEEP